MRNDGSILRYSAARFILKELAVEAVIKKRVYAYLSRHSRATRLANSLPEAQLKQLFGLVQDSKMASTYVHLSGRDAASALLKLHGLRIDGEESQEKIQCYRLSKI